MPKKPQDYEKVWFQLLAKSDLEEKLHVRKSDFHTSHNIVARRDLERFYKLLQKELPTYSEAEAHLLVDVFNGTLFEPLEMVMLWASVSDAEDAYFQKWDVEKDDIVQRLRTLSFAEQVATIDAIERFWADSEASVADVGLCNPGD